MELMDLYISIEELGFMLVTNEQTEPNYKENQRELLHKIETNISCYKAILER